MLFVKAELFSSFVLHLVSVSMSRSFNERTMSQRALACPESTTFAEGIDGKGLVGDWIILNATYPLFDCTTLNIHVHNASVAVLRAFSYTYNFPSTAMCTIGKTVQCYNTQTNQEIIFQILKADTERYMIVNVCVAFGEGILVDYIEVDIRPDVLLSNEEMKVIKEFFEDRGIDDDDIFQVHHDQCNYNTTAMIL